MNIEDLGSHDPLKISKPDFHTYDTVCPHCHYNIRMINDQKSVKYWKKEVDYLKKHIKELHNYFYKIDEWTMANIGDTYLVSQLKELYRKFNA